MTYTLFTQLVIIASESVSKYYFGILLLPVLKNPRKLNELTFTGKCMTVCSNTYIKTSVEQGRRKFSLIFQRTISQFIDKVEVCQYIRRIIRTETQSLGIAHSCSIVQICKTMEIPVVLINGFHEDTIEKLPSIACSTTLGCPHRRHFSVVCFIK